MREIVWDEEATESERELDSGMKRAEKPGIPKIGIKEAYLIWRKEGKLARFPEPEPEAESGPNSDAANGSENAEINGEQPATDSVPSEPIIERKESRNKKKHVTRATVDLAPKSVVAKNPWDLLGEVDG